MVQSLENIDKSKVSANRILGLDEVVEGVIEDTLTGAVSTITTNNLTAGKILVSNANGKVATGNVTESDITNAANRSLDNLNSTGQMIIDSHNGTISNCILEIPQNIKVEIKDNIFTLKAGSILTITGSNYATATVTTDVSRTFGWSQDGRYIVFSTNTNFGLSLPRALHNVYSGNSSSFPTTSINDATVYFNTDDKLLYHYDTTSSTWKTWDISYYPLCCLDCVDGVWNFAKDSNGNDMIFNGAGFIGHHIYTLPNIKCLIGNGRTANNTLNSVSGKTNSLTILNMSSASVTNDWYKVIGIRGYGNTTYAVIWRNVQSYDDLLQQSARLQFVKNDNIAYVYSNGNYDTQPRLELLKYEYNGTSVSDFTIYQPAQIAIKSTTLDEYGITDGANISLSNLDSSGQMVINSVNNKISNCILNIPQNINLTLENNVLTIKAGSILTKTGSTYATYTYTADKSLTISSATTDGLYIVFADVTGVHSPRPLTKVSSGDSNSFPTENLDILSTYYNTDDKLIYRWNPNTSEWVTYFGYYPICLIEIDSGVASFAKDANNNDIIFNGTGFIGHHVFVLPKVSGLRPFGFNDNGNLKNTYQEINALQIYELPTNRDETYLYIDSTNNIVMGSTIADGYPKYIKEENWCYCNNSSINTFLPLLSFSTNTNSIVTNFNIRQPIQLATNENLDDIQEQINNKTDKSIIATGSSESRLITDRFADVINVKDFGAVGDGVTDDTAAFQAAAQFAASKAIDNRQDGTAINVSPSISIYVPHGSYILSGAIKQPDVQIYWILAPEVLVNSLEYLAGRICYEDKKLMYPVPFSSRSEACGWFVCCGGNPAREAPLARINGYADITNYPTTDIVPVVGACYDQRTLVKTIENAHFSGNTLTSVNMNWREWDKVHIGMKCVAVDSSNNSYIAIITGYSVANQTISFDEGWYVHGINGQYVIGGELTSAPDGATVYINGFLSMFGLHGLVDLSDTTHTTRRVKVQENVYKNTDTSTICQPNGDFQGKYYAHIYDARAYGTTEYNRATAGYIARGNMWYGFTADKSQYVGFAVRNHTQADSGDIKTVGFIDYTHQGRAFAAVGNSGSQCFGVSATDGHIEIGDKGIASYAYIDFHTSGIDETYNSRILSYYNNNTQKTNIRIIANNGIQIDSPNIIPLTDDTSDLGTNSNRWKNIYASSGTIDTSDERLKQDIKDINEAVFRAWSKVEFKQFLFNDAVEKKGKENARIHFGVIAQKVKEAFESEGLDGFKYGLLCYDEWENEYIEQDVIDAPTSIDENGNEIPATSHKERIQIKTAGNTYGIRYSEALALECAYQRWKLEQMENKFNNLYGE